MVLYCTLVRDKALPAGFKETFSLLAPHISPAASAQQGRLAMTVNPQAALHLHEMQKRVKDAEKRSEVAQAQFQLKYDQVYAIQNKVLRWLEVSGEKTLVHQTRTSGHPTVVRTSPRPHKC